MFYYRHNSRLSIKSIMSVILTLALLFSMTYTAWADGTGNNTGTPDPSEDSYDAGEGLGEIQPATPNPNDSGVKELEAIVPGADANHDCRRYLQTKYNTVSVTEQLTCLDGNNGDFDHPNHVTRTMNVPDGYHWEQCSICNRKYKTVADAADKNKDQSSKMERGDFTGLNHHNIVRQGYGVHGSNYTDEVRMCGWFIAPQQWSCTECGWSTTWKKPHYYGVGKTSTNPDEWRTLTGGMAHYPRCYDCETNNITYRCTDRNGHQIGCNGGTCAICGYTYSHMHPYWQTITGTQGTLFCWNCKEKLVSFDQCSITWTSATTAHASVRITGWGKDQGNGTANGNANYVMNNLRIVNGNGDTQTPKITNFKKSIVGNTIIASADFEWDISKNYDHSDSSMFWSLTPYDTRISIYGNTTSKIENEAPTITKADVTYLRTDGSYSAATAQNGSYSTKCKVDVECTDNWPYDSNYVQARIMTNDKKTTVASWQRCQMVRDTSHTNPQKYSKYTCSLTAVTEIRDREYYWLQVQDACGNMRERQIVIANLDAMAPKPTQTVFESNKSWSVSKEVEVSCTDSGSGKIRIAFNDTSDPKVGYDLTQVRVNGDKYTRKFRFYGNVYGKIEGTVYFEDDAGNQSSAKLIVWNLDDTPPTITSADTVNAVNSANEVYGWKINVTANDQYNGAEGSGLPDHSGIKYAITTSTVSPLKHMYTTPDRLILKRSGTYYIWAMDPCGNFKMYPNAIKLYSDIYYNGKEIGQSIYNNRDIDAVYYNGKRLRL